MSCSFVAPETWRLVTIDRSPKVRRSNRLSAPEGPIIVEMRPYWPKTEPRSILPPGEGTCQLADVMQVNRIRWPATARVAHKGGRVGARRCLMLAVSRGDSVVRRFNTAASNLLRCVLSAFGAL
jgi:hypothetical protein